MCNVGGILIEIGGAKAYGVRIGTMAGWMNPFVGGRSMEEVARRRAPAGNEYTT